MSPAIRSVGRRNALVPLPLLPPVPRNTIVTSVRIVHNQPASDLGTLDQLRGFSNSSHLPTSPTPTNLCFAPLTCGGTKRLRSGRRRSSCTPCQPPPGSQRSGQKVAVPFDGGAHSPMDHPAHPSDNDFDSSLLNPNRKPRSTILVTVRLANPPPSNASYGSRSSDLVPAPRRPPYGATGPRPSQDSVIGVGNAYAAMQARMMAHRPRVTSPLAQSVVTSGDDVDRMPMDPRDVSPLSSPRLSPAPNARRYTTKSKSSSKKGSKGKNGGRIGMLRCAILNNSGPEVGRRIWAMGPKLAQEIWEAERVIEEIEAGESNEMDIMEHTNGGDTEEQKTRELLAEECIRELEDMEVDSEDIKMEQSSKMEATTTEKATETQQTEKHSNRMDLDMPAPVAVVTPLSPARQVQIQLEIAVQVLSPAKKTQKDAEKSRRWFERIAL